MKMMKRLASVLALLVCLAALTLPVAAEDVAYEKTLTLTLINDVLHLTPSTDTAALWEYPALGRGEKCAPGTMTLYNNTPYKAKLALSEIALPYDDIEQLEYLNQVYITVYDGDTKLYEGTYAHIADEDGGLQIDETLDPGEGKAYTIALQRTFQNTADASPVIAWQFSSQVSYDVLPDGEGAQWWLLGALLGIAAIILLVFIIRLIRRRK